MDKATGCCARLRQFLERNEPFLRFAEVTLVAVVGLWIAWQQTIISKQTLELSRLELRPFFEFRDETKSPTVRNLIARNNDTQNRIRHLSGHATYFLEKASDPSKRIKTTNFFRLDPEETQSDYGVVRFSYPHQRFRFAALRGFSNWDNQGPEPIDSPPPPYQPKVFVALTYTGLDDKETTERFIMSLRGDHVHPISEEPTYLTTIDLNLGIDSQPDAYAATWERIKMAFGDAQ